MGVVVYLPTVRTDWTLMSGFGRDFALIIRLDTVSSCLLTTRGSGSCKYGIGGWAYYIQDCRGQLLDQRTGAQLRATNNRMELLAVLRALEALPVPSAVEVFTDSQYVQRGLTEFLPRWLLEPQGLDGRPNSTLWRELITQCERHRVRCSWVRGHSGNSINEIMDMRARTAAIRVIREAAAQRAESAGAIAGDRPAPSRTDGAISDDQTPVQQESLRRELAQT